MTIGISSILRDNDVLMHIETGEIIHICKLYFANMFPPKHLCLVGTAEDSYTGTAVLLSHQDLYVNYTKIDNICP